jgi:hypothetical protein
MTEPIVREWRFYLDDMTGFAEKVLSCTDIPALLPLLQHLQQTDA